MSNNQFLSTEEMKAIATVAETIHNVNNIGDEPNPDIDGHFEWVYKRNDRVIAFPSADFPSEVEIAIDDEP